MATHQKATQKTMRLALSVTTGLLLHAWADDSKTPEAPEAPARAVSEDGAVAAPPANFVVQGSATTNKPFYLPEIPR